MLIVIHLLFFDFHLNTFPYFRILTLSSLANEKSILNDFVGISYEIMNGAARHASLVTLMEDYTVVDYDASNASTDQECMNLCTDINKMYGWKLFKYPNMANQLVMNLRKLDASLPLPPPFDILSDAKSLSNTIKQEKFLQVTEMSNINQSISPDTTFGYWKV